MNRNLSIKDATVLALCGMLDNQLNESKKTSELDRLQDELRGIDVSTLSDEEYKDYKKKAERVKELINRMYDFDKADMKQLDEDNWNSKGKQSGSRQVTKRNQAELYENKKLVENELTNLKDSLPDNREENKEEIEKQTTGIIDGILVVVDPEINTEDYEEVIDRANEIIEDTEEGKIPYIEDYLNNYIQTCPICGQTFVTAKLLQGGDTCPLCTKQPEAFVTVGQIRPDEDQEKALEDNKELDTDIAIQQDNTQDIMDDTEDIDDEEEETIEEL